MWCLFAATPLPSGVVEWPAGTDAAAVSEHDRRHAARVARKYVAATSGEPTGVTIDCEGKHA